MSNLLTYRVITADGITRAACSLQCAERYVVATGAADARIDNRPIRLKNGCAHCSWCGTVVAVPVRCLYHDAEPCPEFVPLATDRARRAVAALQVRVGGPLPDRCFDYLEKAAWSFRDGGIEGTADLLVTRVWDVRVDWLPQ